MTTIRLKGVTPILPVRSMPASVEFYRKLGFAVENRNDEWGWAMLSQGECRLMIDQSINTPGNPRRAVVYLYPDDVEQYHAAVRRNGVPAPELDFTFYGMKEFRLRDADGNELWIGEPVPAGT